MTLGFTPEKCKISIKVIHWSWKAMYAFRGWRSHMFFPWVSHFCLCLCLSPIPTKCWHFCSSVCSLLHIECNSL